MKKKVRRELIEILQNCEWVYLRDIDWCRIVMINLLSEDFIKEFQDRICWDCVSSHQVLSSNFIIEFQDKLDLEAMLEIETISQNLYNKLAVHSRYELLDFD